MNDRAKQPKTPLHQAEEPLSADFVSMCCRLLVIIVVAMWAASIAPAQDEADSGNPTQGRVVQGGTATDPTPVVDEDVERQRRQNLASVLTILLAGIGITGVMLIAATIIWGAKLRRIVRLPETGPTQQDELWYLKKPPPADAGSERDVHTSDDPSSGSAAGGETTT